ncbi:MAG: hypothetical protein JWN26_651 [Candidatus Saccharibacteria bacterium]|nr:hypothetical protein [Candidatus Saccharibacteria bacterium]
MADSGSGLLGLLEQFLLVLTLKTDFTQFLIEPNPSIDESTKSDTKHQLTYVIRHVVRDDHQAERDEPIRQRENQRRYNIMVSETLLRYRQNLRTDDRTDHQQE